MKKITKMINSADVLVFDLDNTLYSAESTILKQIEKNIISYVAENYCDSHEEAKALQATYSKKYGATILGLVENHQVDMDDYLEFAHDVSLHALQPCQQLMSVLDRIDTPKMIYTNSAHHHATRLLKHLQIDKHFTDIHDIRAANFIPKPQQQSYVHLQDQYQLHDKAVVFFDDMSRNLVPAAQVGFNTVWINETNHSLNPEHAPHVDHETDNVAQLLEVVLEAECV